jgi:hypothetical protein
VNQRLRRLASAACALLLAGCATPAQHARAFWAGQSPPSVELASVPFFPQRRHQCGPAALATVLTAAGRPADPDDLVREVYLPARKGSLQTELVAAARRRGLLPYPLRREPRALLDEVTAGRPVLVLQNLGLGLWPRWHYAVVVGYDVERDRLLLRSGTRRRQSLPRPRFEGTWNRAARWAFVVVPPGARPVGAEPVGYASAIVDLAATAGGPGVEAAYRAGLESWPGQALLLFGLANERLRLGDAAEAAMLLERLLGLEPDHVAARNNYALLLSRRGEVELARAEIERAADAAAGTPLEAAVRATQAEIAAAALSGR